MAERHDRLHSERVRKRIQTSQLINRLQDNALASDELMTAGQIRSAEVLLRKAVPDLSAVNVEPDDEGKLQPTVSWDK